MSWVYRRLVRPALFAQDAEQVHDRALRFLAGAGARPFACKVIESFLGTPELPIEVCGLRFPNPVGLAAGMDKNAAALPAWAALGFGFTELGAVTWHAQPGNPPPRLFRAIPDEAIINRMGFNNAGAEALAAKLAHWRSQGRWPGHPVGINLGKSKVTPLDQAAEDYANSFRALLPHADFFVINVSSPNTPNLRQLQDKAALDEILAAIQETNVAAPRQRAASNSRDDQSAALRRDAAAPIWVKVAPDLSFDALDEILELAAPRRIAGIVATNTTTARPHTSDADSQRAYSEAGGLSGRPLRTRSTEIVRHVFRQTRGALPIIGVGGIFTAADAWEKFTAGASLVQVYTGLVYEGPGLAKTIVNGLQQRLAAEGFSDLLQAVGSATK